MRILLTGGSGSLGSVLARHLIKGHTVVSYARDEHRQALLKKDLGDNLIPFLGDVRDYRRLQEAAKDCDLVIHAAALKRLDYDHWNTSEITSVNIEGSRNVASLPMRKIFISTDKAYQPTSGYGMTKLVAESFFKEDTIIRLGNLVDSRGAVREIWNYQRVTGSITVTDPRATRFWMTCKDAANFIIGVMEAETKGLIYPENLRGFLISDLAEVMAPEVTQKIIGLYEGEKFHEAFSEDYTSDKNIMTIKELKTAYESL